MDGEETIDDAASRRLPTPRAVGEGLDEVLADWEGDCEGDAEKEGVGEGVTGIIPYEVQQSA